MKKLLVFAFVLCTLAVIGATTVGEECPDGSRARRGRVTKVDITGCGVHCRLVKNKNYTLTFHFKPNADVKNIRNWVYGRIVIIPLPFPALNGKSACNSITDLNNQTVPNCELKANQEYIYRNSFPVYRIYPQGTVTVLWGLLDDMDEYVSCFSVGATINENDKR